MKQILLTYQSDKKTAGIGDACCFFGASVHNETIEKGISRTPGHIPTVPNRYFKIYDYKNERKGIIMEKYIIENGFTYELRGEQYYPVFKEPEQYQIGKYGLLHLEYIKAHHKPLYSTLLMEGKLNGYLHEIDEQAREMIDSIVGQMAEQRGVNEDIKARDPMCWVQEMNNCKASAEEIVLREVIYQ